MTSGNFGLRLKHLEDNIKQDLALLKDYEDALRYEDDPRKKAKYGREIEQLRESATCYQKEYSELRMQVTGEPTEQMQNVGIQLQQINSKLDTLSAGQRAIYGNINDLRQRLLAHYSAGEQRIITAITAQMDKTQLDTISVVLQAIDSGKVSDLEVQQILDSTQQMLVILNQRNILTSDQQEIMEVIKSPGIDARHRIKVTIPLIPLILGYEGEVDLGTGINLKTAWQNLVLRYRGE
ncbi:hypothetical protein [Floridanema aerugineum]|uniref:Uncharacterized protein n=1 Tax=Floridaenema aerugineum BLCC-F46 TaxID=3153654 RepID=A0ABV4XCL8_9CYAN